jgi:pilus assembly protein CpaB
VPTSVLLSFSSPTRSVIVKRKIIGVAAAIVLAALGTGVLLVYVGAAEQRALAGEVTVDVLVANDTIPKGTDVAALGSLVRAEKVPSKVRAKGAIADLEALDDLEGEIALVDLVAGEQLVAARFGTQAELVAQTGVQVPAGLLQVTVSLEPQRALGGQVRPGDTVGVLSSFDPFDLDGVVGEDGEEGASKTPNTTHLILHKVLVTNVQTEGGMASQAEEGDETTPPAPTGNLLVTLAVDAPSIERLVFTAEHGALWLSAEPDDAPEDGTRIQTRGTVYE